MIATDMTSRGDPEEKLRWAFRMYDKVGLDRVPFGPPWNPLKLLVTPLNRMVLSRTPWHPHVIHISRYAFLRHVGYQKRAKKDVVFHFLRILSQECGY